MTAPTVLAYGDRALLVELGGTERVVAWVDALRRAECVRWEVRPRVGGAMGWGVTRSS